MDPTEDRKTERIHNNEEPIDFEPDIDDRTVYRGTAKASDAVGDGEPVAASWVHPKSVGPITTLDGLTKAAEIIKEVINQRKLELARLNSMKNNF